MVKTTSQPADLGATMPEFDLHDAHGHHHASADLTGINGTLVIFLCNHCPYVQHVAYGLTELTDHLATVGITTIGINPNDPAQEPHDGPEGMRAAIEHYGYRFPYLIDADQAITQAFGAVCTPDFFLFDRDRNLHYRGQIDDSRPGNYLPVTGESLKTAIATMLTRKPAPAEQKPSLGCSIKWRTEHNTVTVDTVAPQPFPSTTQP